nr:RNA-directed DNA polymerase, eukaryota [Tanacetum cinerariifolium]
IALIPKVPDANLVKDFRPISRIGSMYKIIAKILANRLVGVLGDIVNEVQSAFITKRQILDAPFILNEVIQWCKLKKKQSLIFKVDFEKAYDSVRWDFLDDVLKKFGFGNKWCAWIQSCLRSSSGSIIINGSPTEEFQFFKGLKQGDPLSLFLFILFMESLHLSFQRVMDVGMFKGINLSPLVNLSHMFYADDAVFVGQWCDGNINTHVHVLECFFQASGLRINMCKSKIIGVNVGDEKVKSAASKLGCLILNTLFSYLGTKVGGNMSRLQAWTEVVDKSLIDCVTFVRVHSLSFFSGHELNSNKASWVKWKIVLASKEKEGLGVGKVSRAGSRSCWRNIVNEVRILSNQGIKVLDYMRIKLGNGESTAFSDDNWIGGKVLKSKEDDVPGISTLIYVSNFPDSFSAKDLFHSCKQYGHVVDTLSHLRGRKMGRGSDLFHRAHLNNNKVPTEQKFGYNRNINNVRAKEGVTTGSSKSYVHAVKVKNMFGVLECDSMPSIILDDECLISKDLSKALLGRVKYFASLPNLKIVLNNEGFAEIKIQYMGEFWVLLEFPSSKTKELFQENMGVGSWFSVLKQASSDFIPEGRIVWVEIEGVPFKLWSKNTFKRISAKWGELLDVDDQEEEGIFIRAKDVPGWVPEFVDDSDDDDESDNGFKDGDAKVQDEGRCGNDSDEVEVLETVFDESLEKKVNRSEDPFGIYLLLNKNKDKSKNMKPFYHSLKYPPGFTPNGGNNEFCIHEENVRSVNEANSLYCNMEENQNGQERNSTNKGSKEEISGSVCSGNFKKSEVPRNWGSILCVLEELVKVGQAMGYNMEGCVNNMTAIIKSQGASGFIDELSFFEYPRPRPKGQKRLGQGVVDFVGNSGGILCIWDSNSFRKNNVIVLDYFCMVWGVWLKTGVDILMVVVYAPQELRDKRILWDYLEHVINQWDSEVVFMGDFNEVRFKFERFGSVFNVQGANMFNAFIVNAGLEEVPLGGSSFTWCHKSATKMSKLDRLEVLNSIQHLDKIKAMDVAQKAKIKWVIEGDENTRYFHGVLNKKRSQLNIRGIMVDGKWTEKSNNVKLEFLHHFRNRFDKPIDNRVHIDMNFSKSITIDQQMDLECAVSKEELKRAVWECGTDKSPGPDGFSFGFYRQFWSSIKNDVFAAVSHFFTFEDIPNGCNSCFIALILKVPDANLVKDFRPISLIGSMYKIIAKILANCLVGVLGDIVNEVQSAFIMER